MRNHIKITNEVLYDAPATKPTIEVCNDDCFPKEGGEVHEASCECKGCPVCKPAITGNNEPVSHSQEQIGWDIQDKKAGDPPWPNPHKLPVYKCRDHGEISPEKPKRGYTRHLAEPVRGWEDMESRFWKMCWECPAGTVGCKHGNVCYHDDHCICEHRLALIQRAIAQARREGYHEGVKASMGCVPKVQIDKGWDEPFLNGWQWGNDETIAALTALLGEKTP